MFVFHLYGNHDFIIFGKLSFNKDTHTVLFISAFSMPILI